MPTIEVPRRGPPENNDSLLSKLGKGVLYAGLGGLALAGIAYGGFKMTSPEAQKSITDGLAKGWKQTTEFANKAGSYISTQSSRFWNALRGTRGNPTPYPTSMQAPPHMVNPNGLLQQAPNLMQQ